jgi:anti-sigma B factor antagonist
MTGLEVGVEQVEGGMVGTLAGELDISEVDRVEKAIREVEEHRPPLLVLDLRSLQFIDSSGLRLILATDARAREHGRRLAMIRGPDAVHRVFQITDLTERLEFLPQP